MSGWVEEEEGGREGGWILVGGQAAYLPLQVVGRFDESYGRGGDLPTAQFTPRPTGRPTQGGGAAHDGGRGQVLHVADRWVGGWVREGGGWMGGWMDGMND